MQLCYGSWFTLVLQLEQTQHVLTGPHAGGVASKYQRASCFIAAITQQRQHWRQQQQQ
jgi:hypothetical protein